MNIETKKVAVYGSLRQNLHNHGVLGGAKLLGTFNSKPEYSLYALGGFPGLKPKGKTSVVMEVYEVNEQQARNVDALEGYREGGNNTFYDKLPIETPFGEAGVYVYVPDVRPDRLVKSGDWLEYVNNNKRY